MLTDAIRLLLFPALMAFAASSDLLTMTISNRLSLALAGGFFLLTIITGMSLPAIGMHLAAGGAGAGDCLRLLCHAAGSAAATPSWRPPPRFGSVSTICWTTWSMHRCSAAC